MAESDKNSGGCDGLQSDCKVEAGKASTADLRSAYGKAVASAAIREMSAKPNDGALPLVDDAEVMAFINECSKANEDVVMVVEHIAKREGIDLSADSVPKDADKARLWSFLTSVLKTFAIELAKAAVNMLVSGELSWKDIIGLTDRNVDNERRNPNKVKEGPISSSHGKGYVIRGNGYTTVGYAYTW